MKASAFVCGNGHAIWQPFCMWCQTCGAEIYVRAKGPAAKLRDDGRYPEGWKRA